MSIIKPLSKTLATAGLCIGFCVTSPAFADSTTNQIADSATASLVSQLQAGNYQSTFQDSLFFSSGAAVDTTDAVCLRHVELDPQHGQVIVELMNNPASDGFCTFVGTVLRYSCSAANYPQCATGQIVASNLVNSGVNYTTYLVEKMTILPDGNFLIDEWLSSNYDSGVVLSASTKFHFISSSK